MIWQADSFERLKLCRLESQDRSAYYVLPPNLQWRVDQTATFPGNEVIKSKPIRWIRTGFSKSHNSLLLLISLRPKRHGYGVEGCLEDVNPCNEPVRLGEIFRLAPLYCSQRMGAVSAFVREVWSPMAQRIQ
jgi:hypothetical protein